MDKGHRSDRRWYSYQHPVFWSRKHPAYWVTPDFETRAALQSWLHPSEPPF